MASTFRFLPVVVLLVILCQSDAVHRGEMESMLTAMRSNGYALFSNAIVTSDLSYDLVDGGDAAFTFFAPTDSSLFALDMLNSASDYTATLRCHVVPQRLSIAGLRRLRPGSSLRTLAADHDLRIVSRQSTPSGDVISVDGVDVILPGLFYGRNIAVHGLRGILNCRSHGSPHEVLVRQPQSPSRSSESSGEPPAVNRTDAPSLEANLTIDHSNSPGSHLFKRPAQSKNFSEDNSSFDHSPSINYNLTPSPSIDFSDFIDPPSAAPIDYRTPTSPTLQQHISDVFSPPYLPPEVQQTFGTWTDTSTSTTPYFSPVTETEPPVPEFSENDDPTIFPPAPSFMQNNRDRKHDILVENAEHHRYMPVISADDLSDTVETITNSPGPSDEKTADCSASDEPAHAKFPRGYLYTRHQCNPYN